MAKKTDKIFPKVTATSKVKNYARTKGGKLAMSLGKLHFEKSQLKAADQLTDNQAEVIVTIESKEGFLPGTI